MSERAATAPVISVRGLTKTYRGRRVLDGIDLTLHEGEVLGLLGQNGAGKTTLLETIEGLRKIDEGDVEVLGFKIRTDARKVQPLFGIQLQKTSLFHNLTVSETVRLYRRLYSKSRGEEEALQRVGLTEARGRLVRHLSGGQLQCLSLCLATLHWPRIILLDEPTTGLDPQARRHIWKLVQDCRRDGASIILTTHYMEEAEELCDRVAIIKGGRIASVGRPSELLGGLATKAVIHAVLGKPLEPLLTEELTREHGAVLQGERLSVATDDVNGTLLRLLTWARQQSVELGDLEVRHMDLEDLYLHVVVGRQPRDVLGGAA